MPQHRARTIIIVLLALGICVFVYALASDSLRFGGPGTMAAASAPSPSEAASSSPSSGTSTDRVVALVGEQRLTEADVLSAGGGERPIVIDRLVSQVVAANLAEREFGAEATQAAERAKREVLSAFYLQRKAQSLRASITEAQIQSFYASELQDDQFSTYRVQYVAAPDVATLEPIVAAITSGKQSTVLNKFVPLSASGDGHVRASDMPMGVGQLIRAMKVGEFSRPVVLRNAVFIFHVLDMKTNPKPPLESVKESIKDLMVARQLDAAMQKARQASNIRML